MTLEEYIKELQDHMDRAYMSINVILGEPRLTYGNRLDMINCVEDIKFSTQKVLNILNEAAKREG